MNEKSYSIPFGMVFKKYYCSKCGCKLEKSKTHRVVSKEDKDYYQYHQTGRFPKNVFDVYEYEFTCPKCHKNISYGEQCIIERIQKLNKQIILSDSEIINNYPKQKAMEQKRRLLRNICIPCVMLTMIMIVLFFVIDAKKSKKTMVFLPIYIIVLSFTILANIRNYYGINKLRRNQNYSDKEMELFNKLHAYSSYNRTLIEKSNKCYCFYCAKTMNSKEIVSYVEDGDTAVCPYCGVDSIIPDNVDKNIDDAVLNDMQKYWF